MLFDVSKNTIKFVSKNKLNSPNIENITTSYHTTVPVIKFVFPQLFLSTILDLSHGKYDLLFDLRLSLATLDPIGKVLPNPGLCKYETVFWPTR